MEDAASVARSVLSARQKNSALPTVVLGEAGRAVVCSLCVCERCVIDWLLRQPPFSHKEESKLRPPSQPATQPYIYSCV